MTVVTQPTTNETDSVEWTTQLDINLFQSMRGLKPIGLHKHFRIIQITSIFNAKTSMNLTCDQIWHRLNFYFNCLALDQLEFQPEDELSGLNNGNEPFQFNLARYWNFNHILNKLQSDIKSNDDNLSDLDSKPDTSPTPDNISETPRTTRSSTAKRKSVLPQTVQKTKKR